MADYYAFSETQGLIVGSGTSQTGQLNEHSCKHTRFDFLLTQLSAPGSPKAVIDMRNDVAYCLACNDLCILPYINQGTSEPIKWILTNQDITVALKLYQTVGSLFPKPKDPVPNDQTHMALFIQFAAKICDKVKRKANLLHD